MVEDTVKGMIVGRKKIPNRTPAAVDPATGRVFAGRGSGRPGV
jgi:hypothetical protein